MSDQRLFRILRNANIEEGDYCICNFHDCALKFWFTRGQILQARIVQKLTCTPNKIWFEDIGDNDFYANGFDKIELI